MKNTLAIVTLSLLTACASVGQRPHASDDSGDVVADSVQGSLESARLRKILQAHGTGADEPLPAVELTGDIIFKVLSAEIAAQRGQWQTAYVTTLGLAQQTRDPRLARRAMEIALAAKRQDEALAAVRVWRTLAPHSDLATQYYLGFLMLSDDLAEAQSIFEQRLKQISPGSRHLLMFQMQRLLARAKNKAAGFAMLERVLAPYMTMPEAHLALAQGALAAGDAARAHQEALTAQAAKPDSELAALTLAQATADKRESAKVLQDYLAAYPKAREVRMAYARQLVERKAYSEARDQFRTLLKDHPQDLTALYALGILSAQLNDGASAERYLTNYLNVLAARSDDERDPTQALLLLSQIAEERNDIDAAIKWLSQIDQGDAFFGAQIKRAQLTAKRGDVAGARRILTELTPESERERTQVIVADAHILRDANRLPEAFAALESGIKRFPKNIDLLYDHAMLAEKANRLDVMEKSLRAVIAQAPKNQHAYNALGYSLADRNIRLPEAQALVAKALELAPEDPFIMDSMGWVKFRLGDLKQAEALLRRAYALRPDPEIAVHLGEVLWVKGQKDDAQKFWRDAKTKDPTNDTLKNTLLRLQVQL